MKAYKAFIDSSYCTEMSDNAYVFYYANSPEEALEKVLQEYPGMQKYIQENLSLEYKKRYPNSKYMPEEVKDGNLIWLD